MEEVMRIKLKLEPIKVGKHVDQVMIWSKLPDESDSEYYPFGLTHIDTFWEHKDQPNAEHKALYENKIVYIDAHFALMSTEDKDD
jgi:hypothetical protein